MKYGTQVNPLPIQTLHLDFKEETEGLALGPALRCTDFQIEFCLDSRFLFGNGVVKEADQRHVAHNRQEERKDPIFIILHAFIFIAYYHTAVPWWNQLFTQAQNINIHAD